MPFSGVSITFPTSGRTYNDASFLSNGHQTNFLQCLSDFLTEVNTFLSEAQDIVDIGSGYADDAAASAVASENSAIASAASAVAAANVVANSLTATSATSNNIGTGAKTFTIVESNKPFATLMWVKAVRTSDPTKWMWGYITGWNSGTKLLSATFTDIGAAGSGITDWTIIVTGAKGADGAAPDYGTAALTSSVFMKFKVI